MEKRKIDYLLQFAKVTEAELDNRFKEIDRRMKNIHVGSEVYQYDVFDGYYPKEVVEIVDRKQGIVKTVEHSIGKTEIRCILNYELSTDAYKGVFHE